MFPLAAQVEIASRTQPCTAVLFKHMRATRVSNTVIGVAAAAGAISLSCFTYLYVRTNSGQVYVVSHPRRAVTLKRASPPTNQYADTASRCVDVQSGFHSDVALPGYTAGVRGAYLNTGSRDVGPDHLNSPYIRYQSEQARRARAGSSEDHRE